MELINYVDYSDLYKARIEELKVLGVDEGIIFNDNSEKDFWIFVGDMPFSIRASIMLTDKGNLRAIWKYGEGNHLGVQFLGPSYVEYVVFIKEPVTYNMKRLAGIDSMAGLKHLIITTLGMTL